MKKVLSIIISAVMIALPVGCSNSNNNSSEYVAPTVAYESSEYERVTEEPTEKPTEIQPMIESSFTIEEALTPFTAGRAWVKCSDSDKQSYYALIDTKGYIAWSIKQTSLEGWSDIQAVADKDGTYILHPWSIHSSKYNIAEGRKVNNHGLIVIDRLGDEIFNSFDKGDEYKYYYMGYGDGIVLAIENIADFSENNYYISEIDISSGKAVSQFLTNENALVSIHDNYQYCGDGLFFGTISSIGVFWENGYGIYNRNTHKLFSTVNKSFIRGIKLYTQFADGYALGSDGDIDNKGSIFRVTPDDISSEEAWQNYSSNPIEIGSFNCQNINEGLIADSTGIYDYTGKQISALPDNWTVKGIDKYSGGYAAVVLEGADKNTYVTVIDKNGKPQYEPIKADSNILPSWHGYIMAELSGEKTILNPAGEKTTRAELDEKYGDYTIGDVSVSNGFERNYNKTSKKYDSYSNVNGDNIRTIYQLGNYREIANADEASGNNETETQASTNTTVYP